MAHRSGGGSHSGGHHSGGGHSGGSGGSNGPIYSNRPFMNSRRFRYYDRNGMERYIYCNETPKKMSVFSLITGLLPLIPFILIGIFTLVYPLSSFAPPKPLNPVYEPTNVHIMDGADVIDNEDSLERVLQEFEDKTGISPYIMTIYDDEWMHYDELWEYAYSAYLNTFTDEQHFLIVYSEPENAAGLDFVDWSWEGIQGDDTDPILTESKVDRFGKDLQDYFLQNNISVGEAFEYTFEESLTYMMERNDNEDASAMLLFSVVWNGFVMIFIFATIRSYIMGKRDYQEVPMEGSSNTVPGTMGYGNNTMYQNGTTFQNGQMNQNSQTYQSNAARYRKYMYYDKNGNKKFTTSTGDPKATAFGIMVMVLILTVPMLFFTAAVLFGLITVITTNAETVSDLMPWTIGVAIWNVAIITGIICIIRYYVSVKKRQYIDVTNNESVNYGSGMQNNNASQYNAGMQYSGTQYNAGTQYTGAQYNANTAGAADSDYYNDDSRFRGPEYYDDDARYRGSTAYESGKK